jgi:hypothetical protein
METRSCVYVINVANDQAPSIKQIPMTNDRMTNGVREGALVIGAWSLVLVCDLVLVI